MIIEDEELRNLYKVASADHIQNIETGLLHLEKNPQDQAKLEQLLREMHSLKGDSRMLGVKDVETLTHQLEEILGGLKRGVRVLTPQVFECLYQGLDAVRKIATEAVTGEASGVSVFHVLAKLMSAQGGDSLPETKQAKLNGASSVHAIVEQPVADRTNKPLAVEVLTQVSNYQIDTIRVESQKLDKLLTQASELVVTKGHIASRSAEISQIIALLELSQEVLVSRLTV